MKVPWCLMTALTAADKCFTQPTPGEHQGICHQTWDDIIDCKIITIGQTFFSAFMWAALDQIVLRDYKLLFLQQNGGIKSVDAVRASVCVRACVRSRMCAFVCVCVLVRVCVCSIYFNLLPTSDSSVSMQGSWLNAGIMYQLLMDLPFFLLWAFIHSLTHSNKSRIQRSIDLCNKTEDEFPFSFSSTP